MKMHLNPYTLTMPIKSVQKNELEDEEILEAVQEELTRLQKRMMILKIKQKQKKNQKMNQLNSRKS